MVVERDAGSSLITGVAMACAYSTVVDDSRRRGYIGSLSGLDAMVEVGWKSKVDGKVKWMEK